MSDAAIGEPGLATRTFRGVLWAYGAYVGQRGVLLVVTALLARLLAPEEFGLVSLALMVIGLLEVLADLGLASALVVVGDDAGESRSNAVFRWTVGVSAGLCVLVSAIGPLAARFFDEPDLTAMLPVLGLTLLVRAFGGTHYALAQKRLDFRSRTVAEVGDVVLRGAVGIGLALAGWGAWSLVLGHVAGSVVFTVALWALVRWRPRRGTTGDVRSMLGLGGAFTGVNVISAVTANLDYLVIGRMLGTASLGVYTLAFKLPEAVINNLSVVAGRVLFPAFTGDEDRDRLSWRVATSLRFTLLVCLPMAAVIVVLADDLVHLLFGDDWEGAVGPMRVLTLYSVLAAIGIPAGSVFKAIGRADVLLKVAVGRAVVGTVAIVIAAPHGVVWVAAAGAAAEGLESLVGLALAPRLLGLRLGEALWSCAPIVAAALAGAAVMAVVAGAVDGALLAVVAAGAAGAATYVAALWLLGRDVLEHLVRIARPTTTPVVA